MAETHARDRLKELRKKRRLTQSDLGSMVNATQQMIADKEAGRSGLDEGWIRRLAGALECSEQDFFGPPRHPSVFGYTREPGDVPTPDAALLGQIIGYVDGFLADEGLELDADRKGTVVASLYQLAHRDAMARGIRPESADLSPFDNVIKLAV